MTYVYIDSSRCTGCAACTKVCPNNAIRIVNGAASIDQDRCDVCQACLGICPNSAIVLAVGTAAERSLQPHVRPSAPIMAEAIEPSAPSLKRQIAPLFGGALFLLGKELLPRILPHFIDALDRSVTQRLASASRNDAPVALSRPAEGGHRFRGRRRGKQG